MTSHVKLRKVGTVDYDTQIKGKNNDVKGKNIMYNILFTPPLYYTPSSHVFFFYSEKIISLSPTATLSQ